MERLLVAVCEDNEDDEKRILAAINNSNIPTSVAVFSEAPAFVEDYTPGYYDLIFMDIYLERANGSDGPVGVSAVRSVRAIDPVIPIAFVTTSKDHALDAYRLDVMRYVEKPVTQEAVNEVLRLAAEAKMRQPGLCVRVDGRDVNVPFSRIVFLEQQGHYMNIHLTGGDVVRARGRLAEARDALDSAQFVDCHKSFVANLNFVDEVDTQFMALRMFGGGSVPVRRGSMAQVRSAWEDWLFQMARRKEEALA